MVDRVANRGVDVFQRLDRGFRIDDARSSRQVDFDQPIAGEHTSRSAVALESDQTRVLHGYALCRRSKRGQLYAFASRARRLSGLTAAGCPTTLNMGTSE